MDGVNVSCRFCGRAYNKSDNFEILILKRKEKKKECTLGELYIGDKYFCYTLEPSAYKRKSPCIPEGTYKIKINKSPSFGRELPLLLRVPGRTGIRLHAGNTADDTTGCILPGYRRGEDIVYESRRAETDIIAKIKEMSNPKIKIEWGVL